MNEKQNVQNIVIGEKPDYKEEIIEIVREQLTPKMLKNRLMEYHANDIALALNSMSKDERKKIYSVLDDETVAEILEYSDNRRNYINELHIRQKISVLSNLEPNVIVEYLHEIDTKERKTIIDLLSKEVRDEVKLIGSFDNDEIGSKMTTNYIAVKAGSSIKESMHALVAQAADNDNISTIYVVDEDETLIGAIDLKDLITAREGVSLKSITMTSYPYVYATEQIDECIERIKNYAEDSIPVLDGENKLKGVLISQDIAYLVDDELGDDYAKLAGLSAEEDLKEPLKKSIGKRLPWLMVLLGLGLIVSSVVGAFEEVVAHLTLIVCFQSLILDMAGNVGTQSLAVTIRVLMDEKLNKRRKLHLIWKESRIGLINGVILGGLSFIFIALYIVLFKGYTFGYAFSISCCTGIALFVSIIFSSLVGTVVPILFKKLKVDPAVASGPLITTINDLIAVVTYYGLAWILLINVLGL